MPPPTIPPPQLPQPTAKDSAEGGGCLFIIVIIIVCCVAGYKGLDEAGYIQHTHTVNMYMQGDWLVGENRECTAFENISLGTKGTPEMATIQCPVSLTNDTPHNLDVKFWGRTSRPDVWKKGMIGFDWRCKREESGFTCYATD